jgi:hypothetical protein
MSSSPSRSRAWTRTRTVTGLVLAALFIVALYSAGWLYLADRLRASVTDGIAGLARGDMTARCDDPMTYGYPFSIGMQCGAVGWQRPGSGISLAAGRLRADAPIYDPQSVTATVKGPEHLDLPGLPPLDLSWKTLTTSAELAEPVPEMLALKGSDIRLDLRPGAADPVASIEDGSATARRDGEALDITARIRRFRSQMPLPDGGRLPDLDGALALHLPRSAGNIDALGGPPRDWLLGQSGEIREATLSSLEAGISATGPFDVSDSGLIDARLTITIRNPQQLAAAIALALPAYRDQISGLSGILGSFGGDGGSTTVTLDIRQGHVFAGLIPLGSIPAI